MKKLLFIVVCQFYIVVALAQQKTIEGVVQDEETGQPLEGISVQVKKSRIGTLTDASGHFSLQVDSKANPVVLVISSVGFKAKEVTITPAQTALSVVRLIKAIKVNEDIVVVGYGSQNRSHVTNSISKVNSSALAPEKNVVSDLGKALQGRVPGLYIASSSSTPGAS